MKKPEKTIKNLVVHKENMLKNTNLFGGIVFSQKVLLKLCSKGMLREEAYKLVQRNALDAFNNNGDFKKNLLNDCEVVSKLSIEEIDNCFNLQDYLQNIEQIYKRFDI